MWLVVKICTLCQWQLPCKFLVPIPIPRLIPRPDPKDVTRGKLARCTPLSAQKHAGPMAEVLRDGT